MTADGVPGWLPPRGTSVQDSHGGQVRSRVRQRRCDRCYLGDFDCDLEFAPCQSHVHGPREGEDAVDGEDAEGREGGDKDVGKSEGEGDRLYPQPPCTRCRNSNKVCNFRQQFISSSSAAQPRSPRKRTPRRTYNPLEDTHLGSFWKQRVVLGSSGNDFAAHDVGFADSALWQCDRGVFGDGSKGVDVRELTERALDAVFGVAEVGELKGNGSGGGGKGNGKGKGRGGSNTTTNTDPAPPPTPTVPLPHILHPTTRGSHFNLDRQPSQLVWQRSREDRERTRAYVEVLEVDGDAEVEVDGDSGIADGGGDTDPDPDVLAVRATAKRKRRASTPSRGRKTRGRGGWAAWSAVERIGVESGVDGSGYVSGDGDGEGDGRKRKRRKSGAVGRIKGGGEAKAKAGGKVKAEPVECAVDGDSSKQVLETPLGNPPPGDTVPDLSPRAHEVAEDADDVDVDTPQPPISTLYPSSTLLDSLHLYASSLFHSLYLSSSALHPELYPPLPAPEDEDDPAAWPEEYLRPYWCADGGALVALGVVVEEVEREMREKKERKGRKRREKEDKRNVDGEGGEVDDLGGDVESEGDLAEGGGGREGEKRGEEEEGRGSGSGSESESESEGEVEAGVEAGREGSGGQTEEIENDEEEEDREEGSESDSG